MKPTSPLLSSLLLGATLFCALPAHATVYASYSGSQLGVTQRTDALVQTNYFGTGVQARGLALGANNDLYIAAGNHLINYSTGGALINDMAFPIASINYTDVDVGGGHVVASYNGSQQGFTVRDYGLNQSNAVSTGFNINGIAAGDNNHVYLASGNHLYDYLTNGTQVTNMTFPDLGINYTDVAYGNNLLVASYAGSQHGVTLRDLALNQTSYFGVGFDIDRLTLGNNHDVYLTSGNNIYDYSLTGTLLNHMTFPDNGISYTGIDVAAPVPEPDTAAMLLAGLGLVGWIARRRKV